MFQYICFQLSFSGIGDDLESTIHGVTNSRPQLIVHLQYHRHVLILTFQPGYSQKLFDLNESILYRKLLSNQTIYFKRQVSSMYYLEEMKH